jgi:hypothetical protein
LSEVKFSNCTFTNCTLRQNRLQPRGNNIFNNCSLAKENLILPELQQPKLKFPKGTLIGLLCGVAAGLLPLATVFVISPAFGILLGPVSFLFGLWSAAHGNPDPIDKLAETSNSIGILKLSAFFVVDIPSAVISSGAVLPMFYWSLAIGVALGLLVGLGLDIGYYVAHKKELNKAPFKLISCQVTINSSTCTVNNIETLNMNDINSSHSNELDRQGIGTNISGVTISTSQVKGCNI